MKVLVVRDVCQGCANAYQVLISLGVANCSDEMMRSGLRMTYVRCRQTRASRGHISPLRPTGQRSVNATGCHRFAQKNRVVRAFYVMQLNSCSTRQNPAHRSVHVHQTLTNLSRVNTRSRTTCTLREDNRQTLVRRAPRKKQILSEPSTPREYTISKFWRVR